MKTKPQDCRKHLPEDQRKAMILDAALAEFARQGYDACNVDTIAAKAGIGKGTIYRHYPSKHELFAAVVERGYCLLHEQAQHVHDSPKKLLDHARDGLQDFVDFFVKHPQYFRVMLVEQPEHRLGMGRIVGRGRQCILEHIMSDIELAITAGECRPLDVRFAAEAYLAMARLVIERRLYGRGHKLDEDINSALEICMRGVLK